MAHDSIEAYALIDFDNVNRHRVRTATDAANALADILDMVVPVAARAFPRAVSLSVRLYGSWRWRDGSPTRPYQLLVPQLAKAHHRRRNLAITVSCALGLFAPVPQISAYLTTRPCASCGNDRHEQKLVDTTMVADTIMFATYVSVGLLICTGDNDMIPGALQFAHVRAELEAGSTAESLVWLRPSRRKGRFDRQLAPMMTLVSGDG